MTAFGHSPKDWPCEKWFGEPPTVHQQRFLKAVKENAELSQKGMQSLCRTILEAYGIYPQVLNMGTASVLMDFFRYAPNHAKQAAEKAAWSHV